MIEKLATWVLIAGLILTGWAVLGLTGCVQVVAKLPTLQERQEDPQLETRIKIWKRCAEVHHLELAFVGRELPPELKQAKRICEDD